MGLLRRLRRLTRLAPEVLGSPWSFLVALTATLAWLAVGPVFGWSDVWLILPSTATSIAAFLIVLVLQYSQNRDTRALQLKLDELIRSLADARTDLVRLEERSDEELDVIADEFSQLREEPSGADAG